MPIKQNDTTSKGQTQGACAKSTILESSTDAVGEAEGRRKRKAHKKSRRGCQSCKLRRVKCDEAQPKCQKCQSFGVECSYSTKSPDLKFAGESSFAVDLPICASLATKRTLLGSLAPPSPLSIDSSSSPGSAEDRYRPFSWLPSDLELFDRFQQRTVLTVGTKATASLYQNEVFKLATQYPFLTHVVLTLTLMHERYLTGMTTIGERATMHWLQGTALFQEGLIRPQKQSHRDALWASSAILGCIQFASFEARTSHEAWPLAPASSSDLDWLKMSDGKKAVWKIANTTNVDSVFNKAKGHPDLYRPLILDDSDLGRVSKEFLELFDLGPGSEPETNPYHEAGYMLARLLPVDCDGNTVLEFLQFISRMHPRLKTLIVDKDPRALLLVACWYAKIYKYQWWIYRRGLLEGQAICIYLDRYYSHATHIQNLLWYAKVSFGLAFDGHPKLEQAWTVPRVLLVTS